MVATLVREELEQLEQLRAGFLQRLHLRSDDFEATEGLRVTEAALRTASRAPGLAASQERDVRSAPWSVRRRRWRRRHLS